MIEGHAKVVSVGEGHVKVVSVGEGHAKVASVGEGHSKVVSVGEGHAKVVNVDQGHAKVKMLVWMGDILKLCKGCSTYKYMRGRADRNLNKSLLGRG